MNIEAVEKLFYGLFGSAPLCSKEGGNARSNKGFVSFGGSMLQACIVLLASFENGFPVPELCADFTRGDAS